LARVPLHTAEYHFFHNAGRCFLFNVNSLAVLESCDLDEKILRVSKHASLTAEQLIANTVAEGANFRLAKGRVRRLIRHHFLLFPGEATQPAKPGETTGYVTFMVNVSQRCNLTCPYCYVNKGLFDYEEKPIPRMKAATADDIVDKIHSNFPNFETYGYHFYGGEPLMNFDAIRRIVAAAEAKARAGNTKVDYHITTNGTLLSREVADFMDAHRFTVYFSIDGDQANHDELRKYINGKGSYADVE